MNIRCLVVDDEELARTLLGEFIGKLPQLELVKSCKNPIEVLEIVRQQQIDLLFLDIQMPDLSGIELLNSMREKPLVIFTTAYPDYAIEGYQLNGIDYLLKPFSFERFVQAVDKATEWIQMKQPKSPTRDFIAVHADHKVYKIKYDDILYIEGLKEYVSYYLADQRIIALQSLKGLETLLPADRFARVHRSYIVPIHKINSIDGKEITIGDKQIPLGKMYKEAIMKRVFDR